MPCHETPACMNNVNFPLLFRLTNYWKRFWTMLLRFCLSWCVLFARLGLHIVFCWFGETSFIIFFCFLLEAQKTRAVKSRLVIVFRLIGLETDASCLIGWETDASCLIGWETDASCLIGWETDASCLIGWETDASCLIGWETDASCLIGC